MDVKFTIFKLNSVITYDIDIGYQKKSISVDNYLQYFLKCCLVDMQLTRVWNSKYWEH